MGFEVLGKRYGRGDEQVGMFEQDDELIPLRGF